MNRTRTQVHTPPSLKLWLGIWAGESDTAYKLSSNRNHLQEEMRAEAQEVIGNPIVSETEDLEPYRWELLIEEANGPGVANSFVASFIIVQVTLDNGWVQESEPF